MATDTEPRSDYACQRELFLNIASAFYYWRRCLDETGFLCGIDNVPDADKAKAVEKLERAYAAFLRTTNQEEGAL